MIEPAMRPLVPPYIETLKPYPPGKPIEEAEREYGLTGVIKLASNENPLGPSPLAVKAIEAAARQVHLYPDGSSYHLIHRLASFLGVAPSEVFVGNGSAFEYIKGAKFTDFTDGTSNTIMVVEAKESTIWTKPDDLNHAQGQR